MLVEIFRELHETRDGGSVKSTHFFDIYDEHLMACRESVRRVLEIGVQGGGSLTMWSRYFPNVEQVTGVDINPNCQVWTRDKITVYAADQENRATMEEIAKRHGPFDVIIDDGGHRAEQMRAAFDVLFPHVRDHGWYVVEDTQCSYWARLGGGYGHTHGGWVDDAKHLSDCCTWWAIEGDAQVLNFRKYNKQVSAVHFHPAIVFVRKGPNDMRDQDYLFSDKEYAKTHGGNV